MRILEGFLMTSLFLVLVFLVLKNAPEFSAVLNAFGRNLNGTFRTLQGRNA